MWFYPKTNEQPETVLDGVTMATWALTVVTGAAAFFAWKAFQAARASLAVDRDQLRVQQERQYIEEARLERAFQADLVSAWAARDSSGIPQVRVRNRSHLPVYETLVDLLDPAGNVTPGLTLQPILLPPMDQTLSDLQLTPDASTLNHMSQVDLLGYRVALTFTDSAGKRWHRDGNGSLSRAGNEGRLSLGGRAG